MFLMHEDDAFATCDRSGHVAAMQGFMSAGFPSVYIYIVMKDVYSEFISRFLNTV